MGVMKKHDLTNKNTTTKTNAKTKTKTMTMTITFRDYLQRAKMETQTKISLLCDIFQSKFQALDPSEPRVRLVLQLPFQHSGVFLMSRDKLLDTQGRWKPENLRVDFSTGN